MGKKKKRYEVYQYDPTEEEEVDLVEVRPDHQRLRLRMEKKNRGGKVVTIVAGYSGLGIEDLTKKLKSSCGVGGSAKEGEILLQGDVRKKAIELLKKMGYTDVK